MGANEPARAKQFKTLFTVPYPPGRPELHGLRDGQIVAEMALTTSGTPDKLRLTPDRGSIHPDGQDLSFINVDAVDAEGRFQPNAHEEVEFEVRGPAVIAAVGNGDNKSKEFYQSNHRALFNGRVIVVIHSSGDPGVITITPKAKSMGQTSVTLNAQPERAV